MKQNIFFSCQMYEINLHPHCRVLGGNNTMSCYAIHLHVNIVYTSLFVINYSLISIDCSAMQLTDCIPAYSRFVTSITSVMYIISCSTLYTIDMNCCVVHKHHVTYIMVHKTNVLVLVTVFFLTMKYSEIVICCNNISVLHTKYDEL